MGYVLRVDPTEIVCTLHGWLKIVPSEICKEYDIYNGHPGDVIKYPQLKGKDPQKKAFDLGLKTSGCIIHRVTPVVDDGPIEMYDQVSIEDCKSELEVINRLKECSLNQWTTFIPTLL